MIIKILIFLSCAAAAVAIFKYLDKLVAIVGKEDLAEKYLGSGGTYTMWKIIAIVLALAGIVYLGS